MQIKNIIPVITGFLQPGSQFLQERCFANATLPIDQDGILFGITKNAPNCVEHLSSPDKNRSALYMRILQARPPGRQRLSSLPIFYPVYGLVVHIYPIFGGIKQGFPKKKPDGSKINTTKFPSDYYKCHHVILSNNAIITLILCNSNINPCPKNRRRKNGI